MIILPFPAGQGLKIDPHGNCVGNITMPCFWVSNKAMPHLFPDIFRMRDDSAHTLLLSLSLSLSLLLLLLLFSCCCCCF